MTHTSDLPAADPDAFDDAAAPAGVSPLMPVAAPSVAARKRPKPDARMLRNVAARLKVRLSDCVLVEDALENQKAAFGLGMRTAWMQRYLGGRFRGKPGSTPNHGRAQSVNSDTNRSEVGVHPCRKPAYVCAKIKSIQKLRTL